MFIWLALRGNNMKVSSTKYSKRSACSLHLIAGEHRLNFSIEVVENYFRKASQ